MQSKDLQKREDAVKNSSTNLSTSTVEKQTEVKVKQILNNSFLPNAKQRIKSLDQMNILAEKFNFLEKKQDELNKFILSSDGTKERITLSNSTGFIFEVSNSQTIEKVLDLIKEDLNLFIEKAEKEILNFNV